MAFTKTRPRKYGEYRLAADNKSGSKSCLPILPLFELSLVLRGLQTIGLDLSGNVHQSSYEVRTTSSGGRHEPIYCRFLSTERRLPTLDEGRDANKLWN